MGSRSRVTAVCRMILPIVAGLECAPVAPAWAQSAVRASSVGATFDANRILSDGEMLDTTTVTAGDIDAFLLSPRANDASKPSCLSRMLLGGKTAGQLLAQASKKYGINALFLLVHMQKESSLVSYSARACPRSLLARAFGCGCADAKRCTPRFSGFQNQLDCAGRMTRRHFDDLLMTGQTVRKWRVDEAKTTFDRYTVTPANHATAVLYTYTPWVGRTTVRGNKSPFGNFLFWQIWGIYASALGYDGARLAVRQ